MQLLTAELRARLPALYEQEKSDTRPALHNCRWSIILQILLPVVGLDVVRYRRRTVWRRLHLLRLRHRLRGGVGLLHPLRVGIGSGPRRIDH